MAELDNTIYFRLRDALTECFKFTDLKLLCMEVGINPEKIILPNQPIDDAAVALLQACKHHGQMGKLAKIIRDERPNCPEVGKLGGAIIKKSSPSLIISMTQDFNKGALTPSLLNSIAARIGGGNITIIPNLSINPTSDEIIDYCFQAKLKTSQCSTFFGFIGKTLGSRINDLGRSQFECEFEYAFACDLSRYLFIDATLKDEGSFKGRRIDQWKRINRMVNLQPDGRVHYFEDIFNLGMALQDKVNEILKPLI